MSRAERARRRAVRRYTQDALELSEALAPVVQMAARLFGTTGAFVSFVGADAQWWAHCAGLGVSQVRRTQSPCEYAVETGNACVVRDATHDDRFAIPSILESGEDVRFYASAPLVTSDGHRIGTVGVADAAPHAPAPDDLHQLSALADLAMDRLELRRREHAPREREPREHNSRDSSTAEHGFEHLLEAAANEILAFRADTLEIVAVNRGAREHLGYAEDELLGMTPLDVFDLTHNELEAHVQPLRAGDESELVFETTHERNDDSAVPALVHLQRADRESGAVLIATVIDISERKELEAQLRHAQKMETVGTLAGGIAHDFNNILHSAKVYVQLCLEDIGEGGDMHDFLSQVEQGLQRAEGLVDKLLTFSRQGNGEATEQRVDVTHVVRESIALVEPMLEAVTLRTELDDDCRVTGDPGQLDQVVTNLMTNAVEAMDARAGRDNVLDVSLQRTTVDADLARRHPNLQPGACVRLSVSDTGTGMNADTKERIFEPFFTDDKQGGTGLGLSIVHGIVQAHGGAITVYTEPGKGTTFNVYLPSTRDADGLSRSGASDAEAETSPHILFVDDDAQVLEMESIRLQRLGYRVTTCPSGDDALHALHTDASAFDLVLTDYAMPEMTGLELTEALSKQGFEVPIVLMSGFSAQVSEADVRNSGVEMFLRKPVGSSELETALSVVL